MKTLLILRHGQAEGHAPGGDKERTLTERGEREAASVADRILEIFGCPDLIVASDATRARQTARIVAAVVGYPVEIETQGAIYEAGLKTLLSAVRRLPESAGNVLLVGHNPGLEMLARVLDAEAAVPAPLPTAGMVPLRLETTRWEDVRPHTGRRIPMTPNLTQSKGM